MKSIRYFDDENFDVSFSKEEDLYEGYYYRMVCVKIQLFEMQTVSFTWGSIAEINKV